MISCFTPESLLRGTWFAGLNTAVLPTRHGLRYPSDLTTSGRRANWRHRQPSAVGAGAR
jgi:hypothetical protein